MCMEVVGIGLGLSKSGSGLSVHYEYHQDGVPYLLPTDSQVRRTLWNRRTRTRLLEEN